MRKNVYPTKKKMRALIQRVSEASVKVDGTQVAQIGPGLLVFVGIEEADTTEDVNWLVRKISQLRIFPDGEGVMNRSVVDARGMVLVVSQFTLHASTKKGNRPSYIRAARPEIAIPLYEQFLKSFAAIDGLPVQAGQFGADMKVGLVNDGPVTIWIDSQSRE